MKILLSTAYNSQNLLDTENIYIGEIDCVETHTCHIKNFLDLDKVNPEYKKSAEYWLSKGVDHKAYDNMVSRVVKKKALFVDVNTLNELHTLLVNLECGVMASARDGVDFEVIQL